MITAERQDKSIATRIAELNNAPDGFELISKEQACRMLLRLRKSKSTKFFSVLFIRRHNKPGFPPERLMVCTFNADKYLQGGPPAYNPDDYNLFWVVDLESLDDPRTPWRSINAETILALNLNGQRYKIIQD